MALNINCFTKFCVQFLQIKLDGIRVKYPTCFSGDYILYAARETDDWKKEISSEFGLVDPLSCFSIVWNNEQSEISTIDVADMLKRELGSSNIIVLNDFDSLIEDKL